MRPKALILLTQKPRPLLPQPIKYLPRFGRMHMDSDTVAELEGLCRFYWEWRMGGYEIVDVGGDGREVGAGQGAEESDVRFELVEGGGEILGAEGGHTGVVRGVGTEGEDVDCGFGVNSVGGVVCLACVGPWSRMVRRKRGMLVSRHFGSGCETRKPRVISPDEHAFFRA